MEEYGRGGRGHETRSNLPSSSINQFPLSRIRRKRLHLSSTLLGPQFAFSTSESEKAANSQGERAAAFPYSHSRGVGPRKHYFVIIARKAICASLPVCVRSLSLAAAACTGTLQLGITRLQCGNRLRGSNDCCLRRAKWSPPLLRPPD